ncbi:adenosine kinase [Pseudahrensia aquimaris]|uniref:Adenosine kinase n=1 Tax=Pseudahrensia aquimaris TaxID=744461 RepID=A0ABW3FHU6_9HYPH
MADPRFDVLTVGNAIVDIIARAEDDFLVRENINKGAMNLIDADRAEHLYAAMGPAVEASGGSAGNTAAGIASFGAKAAYLGKVADDHLGGVFTHDIRAIGVHFDTKPLESVPPTARSMIFVTPDGERSMNTYLGACVELGPEDVDADVVAASQVTYFEGYLWDPPRAKEAIRLAANIAHENKRQTAITLSDPFCVDRYREEFLDLMRSGTVDIVFANDAELKSLYQTADLMTAVSSVREDTALAVVTQGEEGSIVVTREKTSEVAAHSIDKLEDTTGAGDLYAAGFLYGLTTGRSMEDCARIGGLAAAEVIQHIGPRPQVSLKDLLAQSGI